MLPAADSVMRGTEHRFGPVDIALANAGVHVTGDVWTNEPDDIDPLVRTNVTGVMRKYAPSSRPW